MLSLLKIQAVKDLMSLLKETYERMRSQSETAAELLEKVKSKLGNYLLESELRNGDEASIRIDKSNFKNVFNLLKLDSELGFEMCLSVTATDWMDERDNRFELVYHLLSLRYNHRLRIKVAISESDPKIPTISDLWSGANFMEREVWDMYGIKFDGHPDLRRILMYEEFEGFPLRKDYPVQGKQPRVPLRNPEVRNTAVDMLRPNLVQINRKRSTLRGVNGEGSQGNV